MGQLLTGKLSPNTAKMGPCFESGKDKAEKGQLGFAFHMQCPRYNEPPTPTASVANLYFYKSKIL